MIIAHNHQYFYDYLIIMIDLTPTQFAIDGDFIHSNDFLTHCVHVVAITITLTMFVLPIRLIFVIIHNTIHSPIVIATLNVIVIMIMIVIMIVILIATPIAALTGIVMTIALAIVIYPTIAAITAATIATFTIFTIPIPILITIIMAMGMMMRMINFIVINLIMSTKDATKLV